MSRNLKHKLTAIVQCIIVRWIFVYLPLGLVSRLNDVTVFILSYVRLVFWYSGEKISGRLGLKISPSSFFSNTPSVQVIYNCLTRFVYYCAKVTMRVLKFVSQDWHITPLLPSSCLLCCSESKEKLKDLLKQWAEWHSTFVGFGEVCVSDHTLHA